MSLKDRGLFVLITGFGTGLAPFASGTFGTLPAVAIGWILQRWIHGQELAIWLLALALVLLAVGCSVTGFVARVLRSKDPAEFVLDEIVGYLLTLAMISFFVDPTLWAHGAAFFFFRLFDVVKPPPARQLEHLPGALGIMLDDVMAGIYAGLVLIGLWYAELI